MAQTPEGKVRSEYRKEMLKLGVKKIVNYYGSQFSDTGHPDTYNCCGGGFTFYVELKAELPNPTPEQKTYGAELARLGYLVFVLGARGIARIHPDENVEQLIRVKPKEVEGVSVPAQVRARCKELSEIIVGILEDGYDPRNPSG